MFLSEKKYVRILLSYFFFACSLLITSWAKLKKYPNILLITADDLGWNSLGCTGNSLTGISPHLDNLAREGILIENCHIATPICGPSRHALYTGQFPHRTGYLGHGKQPPRWWLELKRKPVKKSITSVLHDYGYVTGLIGKHGTDWCSFSTSPAGSNVDTGMGRNPEKYFTFAREFMDQTNKEGKPFFLSANAHDPHRYWARHRDETNAWIKAMMGTANWRPFENGKPYPDPLTQFAPKDCPIPDSYPEAPFLRSELAKYYDSVNRMDQVVGELLHALEETGLDQNTIVIFLSDHGLAWDMSKWSLYPAGTKTPLIIRWPNKIEPTQYNQKSLVSVVDLAPTIVEMCGLPPMEGVDGKSFLSLLCGAGTRWERTEAFSCFNYMNNDAELDRMVASYSPDLYRKMDQYRPSRALSSIKFNYIWNGWADGNTSLPRSMLGDFANFLRGNSERSEQYADRLNFINHRIVEELYDLRKDPGCLNNLAGNKNSHNVMKEFRTKMANFLRKTQDHELGNYLTFLDTRQKSNHSPE
jgi:N-sulfoglucosamine sulfohydrolase